MWIRPADSALESRQLRVSITTDKASCITKVSTSPGKFSMSDDDDARFDREDRQPQSLGRRWPPLEHARKMLEGPIVRYVHALGGQLQINAVVGDTTYRLIESAK